MKSCLFMAIKLQAKTSNTALGRISSRLSIPFFKTTREFITYTMNGFIMFNKN